MAKSTRVLLCKDNHGTYYCGWFSGRLPVLTGLNLS